MKKILSVSLSLLLIILCLAPAASALQKEEASQTPVIIVPGYGASALFLRHEDGTEEQVWGWNIFADIALNKVKSIVPELLTGVGMMTLGQAQVLGKTLGKAVEDMASVLACNPDGTSKYDVHVPENDPAKCRWDLLKQNYGELYPEAAIGNELRDYIEDENLYNFFVDFRLGAVENAEKLDEYIQKVKEFSGSNQVSLYAISHGGQVTAAYLSLYGDKKDVKNAVLTSPAIGGAGFAYDFLNGSFALDEELLVRFIECAVCTEYDFEWLVKAQQLGFADDILNAMIPYAHNAAFCWESLWDFIPMDEFDGLVSKLDPAVYAGLINKTAYFHAEVMAHMGENLRRCRADGVNVSIIAGYGMPIITGYPKTSDAIITLEAATGAKCAPINKRFADGYSCEGTVCDTPAHNHLSPNMEVDASTAYLPENTWFIDGMFHGFVTNEPFTRELFMTLLFTDKIADVHSDPAFPQFKASGNKAYSVAGCFNRSPEGYVCGDDSLFTVTNLSGDCSVRILSVRANGADLTFSGNYRTDLAPHESAVFTVTGVLPEVSAAKMSVTVTYVTKKSITPFGERTLDFTLMNGEKAAFDPENPYCDADFTPPLGESLSDGAAGILKKIGLFDFLSLYFNIFLKVLETLKAAFFIA